MLALLVLLLVGYIICFIYLAYTINKNVSYFEVPIKYTKSIVGDKEYGISIGLNTRSYSISFESYNFPSQEFSQTYYGGIRRLKFFRRLNDSKPINIGCYIETKYFNNKTIPFILSNVEKKKLTYWLNLFSYVKSQYIILWLAIMVIIIFLGYYAAKENMIISLIIIFLSIMIGVLI